MSLIEMGFEPMPDDGPPVVDYYSTQSVAPVAPATPAPTPVGMSSAPEPQREATPPVGSLMEAPPAPPPPSDLTFRPPEPPMTSAKPPAPIETPQRQETAPRPKATAGAVRQAAPAVAPAKPTTDRDILGLDDAPAAPSAQSAAPSTSNGPAPKPDNIEDKHFDPSVKTRQLHAQGTAVDNRKQDVMGEREDVREAYGEQRQNIHAARGEEALKSIGAARDRAADQTERYEQMRSDWEHERKALQQKMGNPPKDTVGMIMGLIGAVIAAKGKPEAGRMISQVVGGAMNNKMNKWKGEIEAGSQSMEGMGKLVNMDRLRAADEEAGASAIHKAVTAEFEAGLDEAEKQAKNQDEIEAIKLTRLDFQDKLIKAQEAARAKAEAARYKRMVNQEIADAKSPEERQWISEHRGDVGRAIQGANQKNQMNDAKLESELLGHGKITADTAVANSTAAKNLAKAAEGPEKTWAPKGWVAPPGLTPTMQKDVADNARVNAQLTYAQKKLLSIAEEVKQRKRSWTDGNTKKEIEQLRVPLVPMTTQATGAGAPNAGEFDRFMNIAADPQSYFQRGDSYTQLKTLLQNTTGAYDNYMDALRFTKEGQGGQSGGPPAKRAYTFSDGATADLSPEEIEALENAKR